MDQTYKVQIPAITDIKIGSSFWKEYQQLILKEVIPYQWRVLNSLQEGVECYTLRNFRIAIGIEEGEYRGVVYEDSDLYKWLEAVGHILQVFDDEELRRKADEIVDIIMQTQQEDGYLNTYYQLKEPGKRWTNVLECHELYCAGHLFEAAVAYNKATGNKKIVHVAERLADHIDSTFGPEEGKLHGYPGHQEIELGLLRLYEISGNKKYINLARYFIYTRGTNHFFEDEFLARGKIGFWTGAKQKEPNRWYNQYPYSNYNQFHKLVVEQDKATGHAVRAVYMYTAMAEMAFLTGEKSLLEACIKLYNNIINRQIYITGGIGSTPSGEAFSCDWDLPNDTNYSETCASIALIFFSNKMILNGPHGIYGDIMERALYNNVLAGLARDGKKFFYVNPLESVPASCEGNPERNHIKPERQAWYSTACCPPNIARLLASLSRYIYSVHNNTIYVHLYIENDARILVGNKVVELRQKTGYPWDGIIQFQTGETNIETPICLALRIPAWCNRYDLTINGRKQEDCRMQEGFIIPNHTLKAGDAYKLDLKMDPVWMRANEKVHYNGGKGAIQMGPLVYCIEEADNGKFLSRFSAVEDAPLQLVRETDGGINIQFSGRRHPAVIGDALYVPITGLPEPVTLTAIPYYRWSNRGAGEMKVWLPLY
jgi:DUF1680 family protein